MISGRQLRFILSGAFNTLIGLSLIYAGMFAGLSDVAANLLGYSIGLVFSFVLNRNWTFKHKGNTGWALLRYLLAVAVAYAANLGCMLLARDWIGLPAWLAQALAVAPYALILYLLCSRLVFTDRRTFPQ